MTSTAVREWVFGRRGWQPEPTKEERDAAARYRMEREWAAQRANYRVAWSQDRGGYFSQGKVGEDEWVDLTGRVYTLHVDAVVDAQLYAVNIVGERCHLHPDIANLTRRDA